MNSKLEIRESLPGDFTGIKQLYVETFPDEDLVPLMGDLLDLGGNLLSLVGISENLVVGHISFTLCRVEGNAEKVALLAPLAVTPTLQKQRIGSTLIETGFQILENSKICHVLVLGDPAYYARFGFKTEDKVVAPYPLPAEWGDAWQSTKLCDDGALFEGRLLVPEPWRNPALWTS